MNPLSLRIAEVIRRSGPIPFSSFMAMALYDETHGYYTSGVARVGKAGDFFTSVSVGPVFGELLAGQFQETWEALGKPRPFTIIEAGANDGRFALDVLTFLKAEAPDFFDAVVYQIDEPSEKLAAIQRRKLEAFAEKIRHGSEPAEHGVFFANELLDAIPFRRVCFDAKAGGWRELLVTLSNSGEEFAWTTREPEDRALRRRLDWIGTDFPDGYTTEIAPAVASHVRLASGMLRRGRFFFIDYGYPAPDYYAPRRTTGTLRCYRGHTAHENPFDRPGETDITAHVDFSLVATTAVACGMTVEGFVDQGRFLTGAARQRLLRLEKTGTDLRGWTRQFQTLTHPGGMGSRFHAAVLSRGIPSESREPSGLSFSRAAAVSELLSGDLRPG